MDFKEMLEGNLNDIVESLFEKYPDVYVMLKEDDVYHRIYKQTVTYKLGENGKLENVVGKFEITHKTELEEDNDGLDDEGCPIIRRYYQDYIYIKKVEAE